MTDRPFFTPPLTVPKKVAEVWMSFDNEDGYWHLEIDPGSGLTFRRRAHRPGVLMNEALGWANDRGLDIHFVRADITKQVPREEAT